MWQCDRHDPFARSHAPARALKIILYFLILHSPQLFVWMFFGFLFFGFPLCFRTFNLPISVTRGKSKETQSNPKKIQNNCGKCQTFKIQDFTERPPPFSPLPIPPGTAENTRFFIMFVFGVFVVKPHMRWQIRPNECQKPLTPRLWHDILSQWGEGMAGGRRGRNRAWGRGGWVGGWGEVEWGRKAGEGTAGVSLFRFRW